MARSDGDCLQSESLVSLARSARVLTVFCARVCVCVSVLTPLADAHLLLVFFFQIFGKPYALQIIHQIRESSMEINTRLGLNMFRFTVFCCCCALFHSPFSYVSIVVARRFDAGAWSACTS